MKNDDYVKERSILILRGF